MLVPRDARARPVRAVHSFCCKIRLPSFLFFRVGLPLVRDFSLRGNPLALIAPGVIAPCGFCLLLVLVPEERFYFGMACGSASLTNYNCIAKKPSGKLNYSRSARGGINLKDVPPAAVKLFQWPTWPHPRSRRFRGAHGPR